MKKRIRTVLLVSLLVCANAGAESVTFNSVTYVYELGTANSFDFAAGTTHQCGSNLYRVKANTNDSIARKFSIVLMAIATGKQLVVNAEACEGNRRLVGWVRVYG